MVFMKKYYIALSTLVSVGAWLGLPVGSTGLARMDTISEYSRIIMNRCEKYKISSDQLGQRRQHPSQRMWETGL